MPNENNPTGSRNTGKFTDEEIKQRKALEKTALEKSCYVVGAGAFSVFVRWLQTMLAFDDNGLVDPSIFNLLVPLIVIAAGYVFLRFNDNFRNNRWHVPENFHDALYTEGKLYHLASWVIGGIVTVGSILLFITSETDKNVELLRVLAVVGILDGLTFPMIFSYANRPHVTNRGTVCFFAFIPILLFCVWLIVCYKVNATNPVAWQYGLEALAIILSIIAFFRVAGYAFDSPNEWRSMFFAMLAAAVDIMVIADSRNIGMQLMFFGSSMMLVFYNWVLITNMQQAAKLERQSVQDGFERL